MRGSDKEPWLRVFLFEVIRELILNVVKHADTKEARIDYNRTDTEVRLSLQDFGKGFDLIACRSVPSAAAGSGLFSLERRLSLIGGTLTIDTSPGHGTTVKTENSDDGLRVGLFPRPPSTSRDGGVGGGVSCGLRPPDSSLLAEDFDLVQKVENELQPSVVDPRFAAHAVMENRSGLWPCTREPGLDRSGDGSLMNCCSWGSIPLFLSPGWLS